jgi:hypothetical protein
LPFCRRRPLFHFRFFFLSKLYFLFFYFFILERRATNGARPEREPLFLRRLCGMNSCHVASSPFALPLSLVIFLRGEMSLVPVGGIRAETFFFFLFLKKGSFTRLIVSSRVVGANDVDDDRRPTSQPISPPAASGAPCYTETAITGTATFVTLPFGGIATAQTHSKENRQFFDRINRLIHRT